MIERLKYYAHRLSEIQADLQTKLDGMELTEYNEEVYTRREECIDALDEIIDGLSECVDMIEDYGSQWRGLKTLK